MINRHDWLIELGPAEVAELESALAHIKAEGLDIDTMRREDFPLPRCSGKLRTVLHDLEDGRGFAVLRGLPVDRWSKKESALVYWGIGLHLGTACAQNAQGEMLGHVRNLNVDWINDHRGRGYQTRDELKFHVDSTDVVGLLCLRTAKCGGTSRIVSSASLHNAFIEQDPGLWRVMCEPFYVDRRGEEGSGRRPWYATPCFNYLDGQLFVFFSFLFESAQRFPEVPRLTDAQREALALMSSLANDPAYYLDMDLQPGDIQFLCNYRILHARTEYEDWPERDRKRHLLRLWLRTPGFARLPSSYADRASDIDMWQRNPSSPIFDASEITSELAD